MLPNLEKVMLATLLIATIVVLSTAFGIVVPGPGPGDAALIW